MSLLLFAVVVVTTPGVSTGITLRIVDRIGIQIFVGQELSQEKLDIVEGLLLGFSGLLLGIHATT
jgi:hypothetical protein